MQFKKTELGKSGNSSMVEHQPSKLRVAGSSLVSRSIVNKFKKEM